MSRLEYLAVAAYNLLLRQRNSDYVLNLSEEEVNYDGALCSGDCLIDDLESELAGLFFFERLEPDTEIDIDSKVHYEDGKYEMNKRV